MTTDLTHITYPYLQVYLHVQYLCVVQLEFFTQYTNGKIVVVFGSIQFFYSLLASLLLLLSSVWISLLCLC